MLNASGDKALNDLRSLIGALLGTYSKGELRTLEGLAVALGTPVDGERMYRFEALAAHLRAAPLPRIESKVTGLDIEMNNAIAANRPKDSRA